MLEVCGDVPSHWQQYVKPHHKRGWTYKDESGRHVNRTLLNILRCIDDHYFQGYEKSTIKECPSPCREVIFETTATHSYKQDLNVIK